MLCSKLTFNMTSGNIHGGFSWVTANGLAPHVGDVIDLGAIVGNPGNVNGCARSGQVDFLWLNLSTHPNPPPAVIGSGTVYCISPGPAAGSTLIPPYEMASATGVWTPEPPLVSNQTITWGKLRAAVYTSGFDACLGSTCDPVARDPSSDYTVTSNAFAVLPGIPGIALAREQRPANGPPGNVIHFGFGTSGHEHRTRVVVHAQTHFGVQRDFVPLDVRVSIGRALGLAAPQMYHSGPVVLGVQVELDGDFAPHRECSSRAERERGRGPLQGVVRLEWPPDSIGKLGLVDVSEVLTEGPGQGRRIGGFVIGLRHDAAPERQVWL